MGGSIPTPTWPPAWQCPGTSMAIAATWHTGQGVARPPGPEHARTLWAWVGEEGSVLEPLWPLTACARHHPGHVWLCGVERQHAGLKRTPSSPHWSFVSQAGSGSRAPASLQVILLIPRLQLLRHLCSSGTSAPWPPFTQCPYQGCLQVTQPCRVDKAPSPQRATSLPSSTAALLCLISSQSQRKFNVFT